VLDVADDADDRAPAIAAAFAHARTERITVRPIAAGEGLVDDRDRLRVGTIRRCEPPSRLQANPKRLHIAAGDASHPGDRHLVRLRRDVSINLEAVLEILAAERKVRRETRVQDA
jgi:hypothetical protein